MMDMQQDTIYQTRTTRAGIWLFMALFIVYLITASGRIDSGDGLAIFMVSQNLLENHSVTMSPPDPDLVVFDAQGRPLGKAVDLGIEDGNSIRGRDSNYYSPYGIGHSLLILPLLALGKGLAMFTPAEMGRWVEQFVTAMLFNPLVSALTGTLVYLTALRLSFNPAKSIALAIIYAFGTMTWVYAKSFFSDPLITLLLLLAFYCLLSRRFNSRPVWLWIGGASLGFAVLTKPASLINIPVLLFYLTATLKTESKRLLLKRLIIFAVPIAVGVSGVMAYNWWRFESIFDTGYRNVAWDFPFVMGLYGLIASPGKGYLLYNPIIIGAIAGSLVFFRQHRLEFWLIIGIVVTNLLFLAQYNHWHGGGSWGPRLILPLTPLLILPLASLLERLPERGLANLLLALLIMVSVVAQLPGLSVSYGRFLQKIYELSVEQYYRRVTFQVTYSPLIGQWQEMREVFSNLRDPAMRSVIARSAFSEGSNTSPERAIDILSANLPDFWFVYLLFIARNVLSL